MVPEMSSNGIANCRRLLQIENGMSKAKQLLNLDIKENMVNR